MVRGMGRVEGGTCYFILHGTHLIPKGIIIYSFIHLFLFFCPTNIHFFQPIVLNINGNVSCAEEGVVKKIGSLCPWGGGGGQMGRQLSN